MEIKLPDNVQSMDISPRGAWIIFATLLFSTFVTIEAAAFQSPAMPKITRHFGIPVSGAALITTLYYMGAIVFAPIMGRLADRTGRKQMVMTGLLIFTISECAAVFSPTFPLFLAARFLQGFGVACIFPVILAYIGALFSNKQRGMALGILTFAMMVGATSGGAVAGMMIARFGWPSIYWVSGGLGLLGLALVAVFVPYSTPVQQARSRFDLKGAVLLFLAIGGLLSTPTWAGNYGMTSPQAIGALAVTVAAMLALWFVEQRVEAPAVEVTLLRIRSFTLPALIFVLYGMCYASVLYSLAFFVVERPGGSPAQFGLVTMLLFGTGMVAAPLSGRLVDRMDPRRIVLIALSAALGVLLMLSTFSNATPLWFIIATVMLLGFANGMKTPASMKIALNAIPPARLGAGSGLLTMLRDVGSPAGAAFGLAVFGATVGSRTGGAAETIARAAGLDGPLLAQVAATAASQGKKITPELVAELQRHGLDIAGVLKAAKEQAMSSAMPEVAYVLMALIGACFVLAFMLPRQSAATKPEDGFAASARSNAA
ncbi:MAG: MFS transporter [Pseudomonadota bacterium]